MSRTQTKEIIDEQITSYFEALFAKYPDDDFPVNKEDTSFYQSVIFDAAKTGYQFDLRADRYHISFLNNLTQYFEYFVTNRKGSAEDYFIWESLACVFVEHCLRPQQIETTKLQFQDDIKILEAQNAEGIEILTSMIFVLRDFEEVVVNSASLQAEKEYGAQNAFNNTQFSDHAGAPLLPQKSYKTEIDLDTQKALAEGDLEKTIIDFFSSRTIGTGEHNKDVFATPNNYENVKEFYLKTIGLIAETNFCFDFIDNAYHRAFLNGFTECYRQQTTGLDVDMTEDFFWRSLSGLLVSSVSDLKIEVLKETLNGMDEYLNNPETMTGWSETEKVNSQATFCVLQDFEQHVLLGDVARQAKNYQPPDPKDFSPDEERYWGALSPEQLKPRLH